MQVLLDTARQANTRQGDAIRTLWSEIESSTYSAGQLNAQNQASIAKIALAACVLHMEYFADNHINGAVTDTIIKFLPAKETLNHLSQDSDASRTLAYCCLCAAADTASGLRDASNIPIVEMLMTWADKDITTADWFTVEDLINLMYGPAAYSLYRTDVESDRQLAALLYEQKTPLLGISSVSCVNKPQINIALPTDINSAEY